MTNAGHLSEAEISRNIFFVNFRDPRPEKIQAGLSQLSDDVEDFTSEMKFAAETLLRKAMSEGVVNASNSHAVASHRARLLKDAYRLAACFSIDNDMRNEKTLTVSGSLHPDILRLALLGFPVQNSALVRLEAILKDIVHTITVADGSNHLPTITIICTIFEYDAIIGKLHAKIRVLYLEVTADMVTVIKKKKKIKDSKIHFVFTGMEGTFNPRKYKRDQDAAKVEAGKQMSMYSSKTDIPV